MKVIIFEFSGRKTTINVCGFYIYARREPPLLPIREVQSDTPPLRF